MNKTFSFSIGLEQKMCNKCILSDDKYYKLKVQFRFYLFLTKEEKIYIKNMKEFIFKKLKEVNKIEEKNEFSFDIYLKENISFTFFKKYLKNKFPYILKESKKVVGKDRNTKKDIFKYSLLFEVFNLRKNDIKKIKGKNHIILSFDKQNIFTIEENTKRKKTFLLNNIKNYLLN